MQAFKTVFAVLLAGSTTTLLAAEQRQHDAHEHGVGNLAIAQDGKELVIELDSPAANIVGFEHAPKSDADHAALDKALATLKHGAKLFEVPQPARCRLVDVSVEAPMEEHGDEEHHGDEHHEDEHHEDEHHADEHHDDEHHDDEHHDDKHAHKDDHEDGGATHSDISATWRFSCARPERLDTIGVKLFDAFPLTERLQVQFVTPERQGAAELTASRPTLRF